MNQNYRNTNTFTFPITHNMVMVSPGVGISVTMFPILTPFRFVVHCLDHIPYGRVCYLARNERFQKFLCRKFYSCSNYRFNRPVGNWIALKADKGSK